MYSWISLSAVGAVLLAAQGWTSATAFVQPTLSSLKGNVGLFFSCPCTRSGSSTSTTTRWMSSTGEQQQEQSITATRTTTDPFRGNGAIQVASHTRSLSLPRSLGEMVRQAASAIKEGAALGQTRQIVRILLPRDVASSEFGRLWEVNSASNDSYDTKGSIQLVPPDESWQGGIMQLYRPAVATSHDILRKLTENAASGLPPRIQEDRSVDESGVDGIGLLSTDDGSVSCWVQPTQEIIDNVIDVSNRQSKKSSYDNSAFVSILVNPQWRLVDDALDTYSQGTGFWSDVASFLGGKGSTLKLLKEAGFAPVYTLEGYICRNVNVRLMQVLDSSWHAFGEKPNEKDTDGAPSYMLVGTTPTRPSYQQVDHMMKQAQLGW